MKPTSLLAKYLLLTTAICATAVVGATLALYALFRASLDDVVSQSSQLFQERSIEDHRQRIIDSTRFMADRLAGPLAAGQSDELARLVGRGRELGGARLVVLMAPGGETLAQAGDPDLAAALRKVATDDAIEQEGLLLTRAGIPGTPDGSYSVGQVFDFRPGNEETIVFDDLLATLRERQRSEGMRYGALVIIAVIAAAVFTLMGFAMRQVRAIQLLTRSAERLTSGAYDEAITLYRDDELGELARSFDHLRERLRTATISRDYLDKVLASMSEALLLTDPDGRITRINAAASRLLSAEPEALVGRALGELVPAMQQDALRLEDSQGRARETALLDSGGNEIPVSCTISEIHGNDPGMRGFIIAARNIAERKLAEQRIRYLARIDALTKVPNRMQFQHLLQRALARAARRGRHLALLYLDVDRFKDINDIYGHSGGDQCLETLAERLRRLLPESATIGRFAGDEFGIVLADLVSGDDLTAQLTQRGREILRVLAEPVAYQGRHIHMTASMGVALYPTDANNVIDLVRSADAALYQAKRGGGDTLEFFDPEMNASAAERLMLKSRLRRAYERDELLVQYQPKVEVKSGRIAGAEALVRWEMSERGIIMPSQFIPLAEESNLILDIGEWVLDRVCHDFRAWQAQMLFPGTISLNLSLKQLRQPNFSQRVATIFRRHGVPPASLELEITESTLMENPERAIRILDELYNMGLSLAIDDFGTGYSSLSALQKFPISTLKIDQSFVRHVATNADDATIVSTIIQMGHGLNLDVIAEGVESSAQLALLRTAGCDYVQGMLFGQPMGATDFMNLLVSQRQGRFAYGQLFA